jgi:anti-sigma regulatory factor (Ser/Thr protein kinase)
MPGRSSNLPISRQSSTSDGPWQILADFSLPSTPGSERQARERVAQIGRTTGLRPAAIERLKTAVAEAALNAMEHGNHFQSELPVRIVVRRSPACLRVEISDRGDQAVRSAGAQQADRESSLDWSLYLIRNMVDQMTLSGGMGGNTIELTMFLFQGEKESGGPFPDGRAPGSSPFG